jgi:hypothetical protein
MKYLKYVFQVIVFEVAAFFLTLFCTLLISPFISPFFYHFYYSDIVWAVLCRHDSRAVAGLALRLKKPAAEVLLKAILAGPGAPVSSLRLYNAGSFARRYVQ